jgi:hypothetical protein
MTKQKKKNVEKVVKTRETYYRFARRLGEKKDRFSNQKRENVKKDED